MATVGKAFVTGATGFIGRHIVKNLLDANYAVVGAVRNDEEKKDFLEKFNSIYDNPPLTTYTVEQMLNIDAFDALFQNDKEINFVFNVASLVPADFKDDLNKSKNLNTKGATNLFETIRKYAPQVEKVVHTGSFGAMIDMGKVRAGIVSDITEESWNPCTSLEVELDGAMANKAREERACWDYLKEHDDAKFGLTVINPPLVFGPHVFVEYSKYDRLNDVAKGIYNLIVQPSAIGNSAFDHVYLGNYTVDVRDLARIHLKGLNRDLDGKRLVAAGAGPVSYKKLADVVDKYFPEYAQNIDREKVKNESAKGEYKLYNVKNEKTLELLGDDFKFIDLETEIVDLVKQIIEAEKLA